MASLYILIPIAIIFVIIAVAIFLWAVKSDQYDDLERQGSNILFEEDEETTSNNKNECHSDNKNKDC
ncbi:TPA: cbb3-type cytochrome oxidase assembly protein CcoS [Photobacterium damselae]|uniref:Cbb3-type cytochrome oxidase assembly protein CcoS n=3 Tax=Photobacterium damselae TaxID=38293 RepID=A0A7V7U8R9_PHODD|nr:cbb3-type cytochrome oxidase assembly protein CcoS [Photobacterium damselae]EHA1079420.1 cbb3-type cytochrome oxidase assembly protein CcoS [Photobacterium damselae]KAB1177351.1 cbb3-type cytochrome oxidase assembly protein CcoS [Photobacterium damselae subsp. damselae]KAB1180582.1 cbb3-type cytochrome oxidase assembly protein CcoS [Photobacterium damselae subsp. damselae]MBF7099205.1 cbb3-type cytochrome oxidase assembly protein CcoS [Photobacterium damselae]MDC4168204.1 cbb3-type cytochro